jgi:hypothetical protein
MHREGPPLENLTRRLTDCPADFLALPLVVEPFDPAAEGKVVQYSTDL